MRNHRAGAALRPDSPWGVGMVLAMLLAGAVLAVCLPLIRGLAVAEGASGERVAFFPVREGESFALAYIHSIHGSLVLEEYRVEGGALRLHSLRYEDTAVGMPGDAPDGGRFLLEPGGGYRIEGIRQEYREIALRTAHRVGVWQHRLIFQGKEYPFAKWVAPGSQVVLRVERISVWEYWRGVRAVE